MSVSVTITYDTAWAARVSPAVYEHLKNIEQDPFIQAGLLRAGVISIDELNPVNQYRLWVFYNDAMKVCEYEANAAKAAAGAQVLQDITNNFPLT